MEVQIWKLYLLSCFSLLYVWLFQIKKVVTISLVTIHLLSLYPLLKLRSNPKFSTSDYSDKYKRKYLFSRNEKYEFRKLYEWAQTNDYFVFPKVRLLDIIEPRSGRDYSLLNKIHAKHVDFVICDKDLKIKFIIELDDSSHDRKDRSDRDEFVRQALKGAGYTLLQTRGISNEFLKGLMISN